MGFLFYPFLSVLPETKTVSHQAYMARLGFSLLLTDLKSQILWSLSPASFSKIHVRMGVLITRHEESLSLHFSIQASFLSTLDTKQFCLNPKPPWPLAGRSLLPSDVGITSVNWVIQSLSSFFNEWAHPRIGCQSPLPCAQFSLVPAAGWWPSISAPPLLALTGLMVCMFQL